MTTKPPIWLVIIWRGLLITVLGFYFFLIYAIGRGLIPSFGGSPGVILKATFFTIGMGGFAIWLALYTEVPEMIFSHLLPRLRSKKDRCQSCNHPLWGNESKSCNECGYPSDRAPIPYTLSWRSMRSFGILFTIGIMLGLLAGEIWTRLDEERIRQAIHSPVIPNTTPLEENRSFQRQWPADFSKITWNKAEGFECVPVFRAKKIGGF